MRPLAMYVPEPGRGSSVPIDLFTAFALTSQSGDKEVMVVLSKVVDMVVTRKAILRKGISMIISAIDIAMDGICGDINSPINNMHELKIRDGFLKILRDNAFNGMDGGDVIDHIARVVEITEWIKVGGEGGGKYNLKTDSENDNDKVNMPSFPPPEPTISYFDDLDFFKDFEKEFPAIVYNNALTKAILRKGISKIISATDNAMDGICGDINSPINNMHELKIRDEFLKILRDNAFNGMDKGDMIDHIARVVEITEWIKKKHIHQTDSERCEEYTNSEEPIRCIEQKDTAYSKSLGKKKSGKTKNKHLYSASANEIDEKKPELKDLPSHLEYAYLKGDTTHSVIISSKLTMKEKVSLLQVLEKHEGAIAWKMLDIKRISLSFCTHKILMEESFKPVIQPQRQLNPKVQDVVKNRIVRLLDSGLIYPISDSPWVSLIYVIPKKGGITVVLNDNNELIPS
ncbi:hypothetical protein Tco_0750593 [Tanacetum coccineum]|uniref:Reverse transcriptase domain-containing protein n=1 Tax=Tanacetum coccineum TaxID=301880 RepID=A0ABQ4Z4G3_9ASTR